MAKGDYWMAVVRARVVVRCVGAVLVAGAASVASASAFGGGSPALTPLSMLPSSIGFFDWARGLIGTAALPCRPITMISIPQCRAGAILATTDGGRTTRLVLRAPGPVTSIAVAPGGQAWAFSFRCSSAPMCTQGTLFHSQDEGHSWRAISHRPLAAVSFADSSHGLAVLYNNLYPIVSLAASADSGKTWQPVETPCGREGPTGIQVQGVSLVTRTRGWLLCMGNLAAGGPPHFHQSTHKSIYRTDDGGQTWKLVLAVSRSAANGLPLSGTPTGIAFAPNGVGVIWETSGSQYLTRDGGLHWQPLEPVEKEDGIAGFVTQGRLALVLHPPNQYTVRLALTNPNRPALTTVHTWRY